MPTNRIAKQQLRESRAGAWRQDALCRVEPDMLLEEAWYDDDLISTAACMKVCMACPVLQPCGDEVMELDLMTDKKQVGTMGGTHVAQRTWLRSNPDMARAVAQDCTDAGVDPRELSLFYELEGLSAIPDAAEKMTPMQIEVNFGVHVEVWNRWMVDRGRMPAPRDGRTSKVHLEAYEEAERVLTIGLQGNDGWVQQARISEALREVLPLTAVAHTKKAQTGNTKSAWVNLAYSVIQSFLRSGKVEQRWDPANTHRRQLRWTGQVIRM